MSRHIQVTFDAHDPRALSSFWRDALGYVHPGPPGVDLPQDADPLAAWDDFLARVGVPEEQRNTRSAIEDPDGTAHGCSSSRCQRARLSDRVHIDVRAAPRTAGRGAHGGLGGRVRPTRRTGSDWVRRYEPAPPDERRLHRNDRSRGRWTCWTDPAQP